MTHEVNDMRLTNELLKSIVLSEARDMKSEAALRRVIRRHVRLVLETGTGGDPGGSSGVKGDVTSAVKTAAKALEMADEDTKILATAATAAKKDTPVEKLPRPQQAALAKLGYQMIQSDSNETVKAAAALKKVGEQPDKPQSGTDTGSSGDAKKNP